jgi:hypothetical protein
VSRKRIVTLSTDAAFANDVLNDAEVFGLVAFDGTQRLDISPHVGVNGNVLLTTAHGGFLFIRQEPGVYQLHTFFRKDGRGRHALLAAHDAADFMFLQTDCLEILTVAPDDNPLAHPPRHMGFVQDFRRDDLFFRNGISIGAAFYALRYHDWIRRATWLEGLGRSFHDRLEARTQRDDVHPDDAEHDKRVGACCAMIEAGQIDKACLLYNRWAMFAGYMPILIESREPLILDMGESRLKITDDRTDFEVLTCQ